MAEIKCPKCGHDVFEIGAYEFDYEMFSCRVDDQEGVDRISDGNDNEVLDTVWENHGTCKKCGERVNFNLSVDPAIEALRKRYEFDDDVEVGYQVSESDGGTWVSAWIWVPDHEYQQEDGD